MDAVHTAVMHVNSFSLEALALFLEVYIVRAATRRRRRRRKHERRRVASLPVSSIVKTK